MPSGVLDALFIQELYEFFVLHTDGNKGSVLSALYVFHEPSRDLFRPEDQVLDLTICHVSLELRIANGLNLSLGQIIVNQ